MAAGAILGGAVSGGSGGISNSSSAGGSGDVLFGDARFGAGPVINVGQGVKTEYLLMGGAALVAVWLIARRK